jgi:hypothetical protein
MALTLDDLGKDRESSLAGDYLYRFGQFALNSRKRTVSRAGSRRDSHCVPTLEWEARRAARSGCPARFKRNDIVYKMKRLGNCGPARTIRKTDRRSTRAQSELAMQS